MGKMKKKEGQRIIEENKIVFWGIHIVSGIFIVIMGYLTILSLWFHCKVNIDVYGQPRYIESHRPIVYLGLSVVVILVFLLICHAIHFLLRSIKKQWYCAFFVLGGSIILTTLLSIFWILFNDSYPKHDQLTVFNEARIIAGYATGKYNVEYFEIYPRNTGLVLLMSIILSILGDTQISFRILNVIAVLILFLSLSFTVKKAWKNEEITILTTVMLTIFFPIIVYTSFLYGTLLSVAFASCGIYGAVRFGEEKDWKSVAIISISFPIALQMHQSAAITMIAVLIYMLIHVKRDCLVKFSTTLFLLFILILGIGKGINLSYEQITGYKPKDPIPTTAYLYMGITAYTPDGGPGAQDGSASRIHQENQLDAKASNKEAIEGLKRVIGEYINGERSLSFFTEKVKFQWLDPTMGARKIIVTNHEEIGEPPNSAAYEQFYHSEIRELVFRVLIIFMIIIYGFSLVTGIKQFSSNGAYRLHFLIQIMLIGGFTFQLVWESLSRYCLPYFIWLIPEAAFGLYSLYTYIFKRKEERIGKK